MKTDDLIDALAVGLDPSRPARLDATMIALAGLAAALALVLILGVRPNPGDILTTPERSRVMLRPYGSRLPDLVDQPDNPRTRLAIYAATAMALLRWEPRVQLTRVTLERPRPGALHLRILGRRVDLPRPEGFDFAYPLHPAPSAA